MNSDYIYMNNKIIILVNMYYKQSKYAVKEWIIFHIYPPISTYNMVCVQCT